MPLSEFNKEIWLWLLNSGGYWTSEEIARHIGQDPVKVFRAIDAMTRRKLIVKQKSKPRMSYCVDGTCFVPKGMRLAEVQE